MRIGFGAPIAGAWATPGYLAAFAERAETAGYASLWTFQRLLVPEGSGMEPVYRSVLDPMVALGYAAARTSRIRLGVAVVNLPFVSPAYLAKQAATVDVLSGGRLDHGPARRAHRGVPGCPAHAVGRRSQLASRRVLHGPGGTARPQAGAATR